MKRLLLYLFLLVAPVAHAVDLEIGAGVAHYTPRGDMMWYQEGLPHKLDLTAPALEIGLADTFWQSGAWSVDWRASYVYIGSMHSDAIATDDANYDKGTKSCIGVCTEQDRYMTTGHMSGLRLTLQPTYTYNGWRFGIEGGAYIYKPTFHANVYRPDYVGHVSYDSGWQVAPVVGASIGRGPWSLAYLHYFSKTLHDPTYAFWRATDAVTLRFRF